MKYGIEVRLTSADGKERWERVCPASPYETCEYPTREQAETIMNICYPESLRVERLGGPQVVRLWEAA